MSTKIYSGFLLPVTTLPGLFRWKRKLQDKFEATCAERLSKVVASRAITLIDKQITFTQLNLPIVPVITENPYVRHAAGIVCAQIEKELKPNQHHCLRDDYQLDMTILFAKGKCLAMLHNDSRYCTKFFKENSNARPLPYWDNTDPDPYVTPENWKAREELWEEALYGAGVPAECGLHFTSKSPEMYLWTRAETPTFPSLTARAEKAAFEYLLTLNTNQLEKNAPLSEYMRAMDRTRTSKKRIKNIAELIYPFLPKFTYWRELGKFELKTQ